MEQKTIEKVLNQISEERLQDHQELRTLKAVQIKQNELIEKGQEKQNLLSARVDTLKTEQQTLLQKAAGPIQQIEMLSGELKNHGELLKTPLIQKIVHVHHVPKFIIVTVLLFCMTIGLIIAWYQSNQRLAQYINTDTKWRKLMLDAKPVLTKIMLDVSDSVDQNPDNIREAVKVREDHNQQVWLLQQKMKADSAEMRSLLPYKSATGNNGGYIKKKK